jgi:phage N-6-adenine-methyltransferase
MPKQKPRRSRQDYATPAIFILAACRRLGILAFSLDIAAAKGNAVAPRFFSRFTDAFTRRWRAADGGWSWLNPPFTDIGRWTERACIERDRGARIAMLVPAAVGANWWRDYVDGKACVLFLNGRIAFHGQPAGYPKDCALLIYAADERQFRPGYRVWRWRREVESVRGRAAA